MERNTTAYQLNILRDTQMVQRRLLEKQFPYLDWSRIPFSSYVDFFRLRGILDDCGAVWTNAYGRSNDEAESTRKYLKDYSGNGRDIELFNFGYSKGSGYNGYVQDFRNSGSTSIQGSITESKIDVTNIAESASTTWIVWLTKSQYVNAAWKAYVEFDGSYANIVFSNTSDYHTVKSISLQNGKIAEIPALTEEELADYNQVAFAIPKGSHLTLTQIAPYQGAIVGDGIDDYGQCVKDFALPDDYTVVAMREILNGGPAGIINKTRAISQGAFIFEYAGSQSYSYGDNYSGLSVPKLFSYQTKASYNGTVLTTGTGTDTADDKLLIFRLRDGVSNYISAALYSFGVFTRTLTEEELRIVENCMYAEWIAMTGKLEDIEYYDILDARFRSNDEDADKRNKWVGRLGKLHLTLNNYAYSQMSGWNGTRYNFISLGNISTVIDNKITIAQAYSGINTYSVNPPIVDNILSLKAKFTGIDRLVQSGEITGVYLIASDSSGESLKFGTQATKDGIVELSVDVNDVEGVARASLYVALKNTQGATLIPLSSPITIEVFPDYGGALVSDGVDDNAVSSEVIDEEIGGFVCHAEFLAHKGYIFSAGAYANAQSVFYAAGSLSNQFIIGNPNNTYDGFVNPVALSKTPTKPNVTLSVASVYNGAYSKSALYQLRLIKTQPTETQLEAIKWQCRKEHDDYLIHMGWKEVE